MPRNRRRVNPLARIGVLLVIVGFGSAVLNTATDYQFTYLTWADGMQPYAGIVIGLIGVALLGMPFILRARERSSMTPIAPAAAFAQPVDTPAFPAPQPNTGFPMPQPGAGYPMQAPGTGFPQPAAWEQSGFGQQPPSQQQFGSGFPQQQFPQQFPQQQFPQQQFGNGYPQQQPGPDAGNWPQR